MSDAPVRSQRRKAQRPELQERAMPPPEPVDLIQKRQDIKKQEFLLALESNMGLLAITAKQVGVTMQTIRTWAKDDPNFFELVEEGKEYTVDIVETQLFKKIQGGDTTAIIFYLKTKGRNRGYGATLNIEGHLTEEKTIKISQAQKELPADVLDTVLADVFERPSHKKLQLVAKTVQEAVVEHIVENPTEYLEDDQDLDEEIESHLNRP